MGRVGKSEFKRCLGTHTAWVTPVIAMADTGGAQDSLLRPARFVPWEKPSLEFMCWQGHTLVCEITRKAIYQKKSRLTLGFYFSSSLAIKPNLGHPGIRLLNVCS